MNTIKIILHITLYATLLALFIPGTYIFLRSICYIFAFLFNYISDPNWELYMNYVIYINKNDYYVFISFMLMSIILGFNMTKEIITTFVKNK